MTSRLWPEGDVSTGVRVAELRHRLQKDGLDPQVPPLREEVFALVETVLDTVIHPLQQRCAELEKRLAGLQTKADRLEGRSLVFHGDWQEANSYEPGALVRHRDGVFTALRSVPPGRAEPGRQGSGWGQII